jgi:fatty acid desaturase
MKEYVPPGTTEAAAADQRADSRFADALRNNQRADNYTILTVLFALVLFFAAASTRLGRLRAQWIVLGVAIVFLVAAMVILATFPIDF